MIQDCLLALYSSLCWRRGAILLRTDSTGMGSFKQHFLWTINNQDISHAGESSQFSFTVSLSQDPFPQGSSVLCSVTRSRPTLWPMDCSPPVSSVREVSQARILEWFAISYSGGSFQARGQTHVSSLLHWQVDSLLLSHLRSPKGFLIGT